MAELLLELFSEEMPARLQARAAEDLRRLIVDGLKARVGTRPRPPRRCPRDGKAGDPGPVRPGTPIKPAIPAPQSFMVPVPSNPGFKKAASSPYFAAYSRRCSINR